MDFKRTEKVKYLGRLVQPNGLDKDVNRTQVKNLKLAYRLTQNRYNKRAVCYQAEFTYYTTSGKTRGSISLKCLTQNKKMEAAGTRKIKRKIFRSIQGHRKMPIQHGRKERMNTFTSTTRCGKEG